MGGLGRGWCLDIQLLKVEDFCNIEIRKQSNFWSMKYEKQNGALTEAPRVPSRGLS